MSLKIAVWTAQDDACYKYRCLFPLQTLVEKGIAQFRTYKSPDLDKSFMPDIAIFQKMFDPRYLELAQDLKAQGIKVIYETDDDYFCLDPSNMAHLTCSNQREATMLHFNAYKKNRVMQDYFKQYNFLLEHDANWVVNNAIDNFNRMLRFMKLADAVQTSTNALSKSLRGWGIKCMVLPNLERESEWKSVPRAPLLGRIVLAWSGSFSHIFTDLHPIKNAVAKVMKENEQVHLHLWGGTELRAVFDGCPQDRVFAENWVSWEKHKELTAEADIILAPSFGSKKFAQSKSTIRVQQGWMKSIPCVASNLTYGQAIRDSDAGLIANSNREWYLHISALCNSSTLRMELGGKGLSYMEDMTYEKNYLLWKEAYERMINDR